MIRPFQQALLIHTITLSRPLGGMRIILMDQIFQILGYRDQPVDHVHSDILKIQENNIRKIKRKMRSFITVARLVLSFIINLRWLTNKLKRKIFIPAKFKPLKKKVQRISMEKSLILFLLLPKCTENIFLHFSLDTI